MDVGIRLIKVDIGVRDKLWTLQKEDITGVVSASECIVAQLVISHTYFVFVYQN